MRKGIAIVLTVLWITGAVAFVMSSQDDLDKLEHIRSHWSRWPTTQGIITGSEIVTESAPNGEEYEKLRVAFRYRLNDIRYENMQSWYVAWQVDEQVKEYPPGKPVKVHYDPTESWISVIEPEKIPGKWVSIWLVYVPAICWGILGCLLIWGSVYGIGDWFQRRRNRACAKS